MNHQVTRWLNQRALGLALSSVVGLGALLLARTELALFGQRPLDALVLAILLGMAVRTVWQLPERVLPGVRCAAKPVLELAVVFMGASIDGAAVVQTGGKMAGAVIVLVVSSIAIGTLLGRAFGLPTKLATLVACGNSICGNSAIASIAPVIDADEESVVASIAFTAILSIGVVLVLPIVAHALGFNAAQFGVLAGLTVYAVPQVLAVTSGAGLVAVQVGTLVKLTRVLMLGPVVCFFALRRNRHRSSGEQVTDAEAAAPIGMKWTDYIPPFILGFIGLAIARSTGVIGVNEAASLHGIANGFTLVAMAGLGLLADLRVVRKAGGAVMMTAVLSLGLLAGTGVLLIRVLHL